MFFRKLLHVLFDSNSGANGGANGGEGGAAAAVLPEWAQAIPFSDEIKGTENFTKDLSLYKTPDDFYKSYRGSQELVGRKGVIIPKEGDAPEIHAKYRESLGIPEKPEAYKLTLPEKLHPNIKVTPEGQKDFFEFAHKNGFSNAHAQELNSWYLSKMSEGMFAAEKQAEAARVEGDTALRKEWGSNYEVYNAQAEKAWVVFSKTKGADGKVSDLLDPDSFKDPNVKRVFQIIGSKISEDTFKSMTTGAAGGDQSVQSQITAILRDPKSAYNDGNHLDHKQAVQEMLELNKKLGA